MRSKLSSTAGSPDRFRVTPRDDGNGAKKKHGASSLSQQGGFAMKEDITMEQIRKLAAVLLTLGVALLSGCSDDAPIVGRVSAEDE